MKAARIKPRSKIWIEHDGTYIIGDGRAELLNTIHQIGSISEAARGLGISYRHAWGYIKKIEKRLGMKVVATTTGGTAGGGARLTKRGKDFVDRYLRFRQGINEYINRRFVRYFQKK